MTGNKILPILSKLSPYPLSQKMIVSTESYQDKHFADFDVVKSKFLNTKNK